MADRDRCAVCLFRVCHIKYERKKYMKKLTDLLFSTVIAVAMVSSAASAYSAEYSGGNIILGNETYAMD